MKILFVVESISEKCGANVNIVCSIAKKLIHENEIDILSQSTQLDKVDSNILESFSNVYSFNNSLGNELEEFKNSVIWNEKGYVKKLFLLICNRKAFSYLYYYYFNSRYLLNKYKKEIKVCSNRKKYDAIIAVCNPHYLADSLVYIHLDGIKGVYQLDPYSFHQMASRKTRLFRIIKEKRWIRKYDFFITTPIIAKEFRKNGLKVDYSKIYELDFPLISEEKWLMPQKSKSDIVGFYFVGNFYSSIRSPKYLLKLFSELPSNYVLHLVGKGAEKEINNSNLSLEGRIVNHGWVPPIEASRCISDSDILININNDVTNMLPSKTIEYIGTGKPIINICKRKDCPSLGYMGKYPNCLILFEDENALEKDRKSVIDFVNNNLGHTVVYDTIRELFYDNTVECVSKKIGDIINKSSIK